MDIHPKYKSAFGYQTGGGGVDSYGVDHSNFSLRDEIEYQTNRVNRENQLQNYYNNQGITENYPQYGKDFWNAVGSIEANSNVNTPSSRIYYNYINKTNPAMQNFSFSVNKDIGLIENTLGKNTKTKNIRNRYVAGICNNEKQQSIRSNAYMTPIHPDYKQPASLLFDGKHLAWLQNGHPIKYYNGQSGKNEHQTARDTKLRDLGPIPEGDYILKGNSGQHYEPGENVSIDEYLFGGGRWKKNPDAWGYSRIPIEPMPETNTFGRYGMYVHGGKTPGSAGCIDLTGRMEDFYNDFKNYNGNLRLKVKYPEGW